MSARIQTAPCWSCGAPEPGHFCDSCGKVQPAGAVDHFTFFGLPRKLNLGIPALEKEFYRLSRRLHPDVAARCSAQEQQWSLEKSSQLNDAYRTLKDPISRTRYLLELEGVKLEEQSSAATEAARVAGGEKKQIVPPELLEEVFELNLQLQELKMSREMGEDDPTATAELESARIRFEEKLGALEQELRGLWGEWDGAVDSSHDAERARVRDRIVDVLNRRNYIRNLVRDVNAALGDTIKA